MRGPRLRATIGVPLALLAAGCPGLQPAAPGGPAADPGALLAPGAGVPPIVGRVWWPERVVQAEMKDVAQRATVTLIETDTNTSLASAISDTAGNFSLATVRGFVPRTDKMYYVEAYKGLYNNSVGQDAARVRTVVLFSAGWTSLTGISVAITRATTAVSALLDLKNIPADQRVNTMSKVGTEGTPPPFQSGGTGISDAEYVQAFNLVTTSLGGNRDPLDSILWTNNSLTLRPGIGLAPPSISDVVPPQAVEGDRITLYGRDFDPVLTRNAVDFGGIAATPSAIAGGRIDVTVPLGARSGLLTVTTQLGSGSIGFTVLPVMPGKFIGF
ncbi:MAG: hypothetical protein FJZ01_14310 [Candidatus Sericytochromatia bacterium]|nr:hypothetical protein [Candidatus Tanganyikabacteria bacterium]